MRISKAELLKILEWLPDEIEVVINEGEESFPDVVDIRKTLLDDHGRLYEEDEWGNLGAQNIPYSEVLAIEVS